MTQEEIRPVKLPDELHNHLVKTFESRANSLNYKGKKKVAAQADYWTGAIRAFDYMSGNLKNNVTGITPAVFIALLRGDQIKSR